jgi:hypothetical protein
MVDDPAAVLLDLLLDRAYGHRAQLNRRRPTSPPISCQSGFRAAFLPRREQPRSGNAVRGRRMGEFGAAGEDRVHQPKKLPLQDGRSTLPRNESPPDSERSVWLKLRSRAHIAMLRLLARCWRSSPKRSQNTAKWNAVYENLTEERLWGDETTYRLAAQYLADVDVVEDWGCGSGGFRFFCRTNYIGVDGSATPFADKIVDLSNYTSSADGILLRHVLEHNIDWEVILHNAVKSFRRKLCIILFTPFGRKTKTILYDPARDVVTISFRKEDISKHLSGCQWSLTESIPTSSYYKSEHIFFVSR